MSGVLPDEYTLWTVLGDDLSAFLPLQRIQFLRQSSAAFVLFHTISTCARTSVTLASGSHVLGVCA